VVERDKASEGLLASGDKRMEKLIDFCQTLFFYHDRANGKSDNRLSMRVDHGRIGSSDG
jgi:DNA sulfur modification protein DndC